MTTFTYNQNVQPHGDMRLITIPGGNQEANKVTEDNEKEVEYISPLKKVYTAKGDKIRLNKVTA